MTSEDTNSRICCFLPDNSYEMRTPHLAPATFPQGPEAAAAPRAPHCTHHRQAGAGLSGKETGKNMRHGTGRYSTFLAVPGHQPDPSPSKECIFLHQGRGSTLNLLLLPADKRSLLAASCFLITVRHHLSHSTRAKQGWEVVNCSPLLYSWKYGVKIWLLVGASPMSVSLPLKGRGVEGRWSIHVYDCGWVLAHISTVSAN